MKPFDEEKGMMHLDDDAFAELTMGGVPDVKAAAHLESCSACREELARFEESVGSFNMASLAWSEEKSEGLPALRPAAKAKAGAPRFVPALSWGLALLLAVGVAVPVKMHYDAAHDLEAKNAAPVGEEDDAGLNSPEQIAKDNELMADVNYELVHSQTILLSKYDRQRGVRSDTGITETGKRSR